MSDGVTDSEQKTIAGVLVFSLLWIFFVIPYLSSSPDFRNLSPLLAYPIYNIGFILGLGIIVFGGIYSLSKLHAFEWKTAIVSGLSFWFSVSFILDMWQPPNSLLASGIDATFDPSVLINASSDRFLSTLISAILPGLRGSMIPVLNISWLYVSVYFVVPILTVLLAAAVFTEGQFIKWLGGNQ